MKMKNLISALVVIGVTSMGSVTPAFAQSESRCGDRPSFMQPFTDAARDARRMATRDTAGWLGAGAISALAAHQGDAGITRSLTSSGSINRAFRRPSLAARKEEGTPGAWGFWSGVGNSPRSRRSPGGPGGGGCGPRGPPGGAGGWPETDPRGPADSAFDRFERLYCSRR